MLLLEDIMWFFLCKFIVLFILGNLDFIIILLLKNNWLWFIFKFLILLGFNLVKYILLFNFIYLLLIVFVLDKIIFLFWYDWYVIGKCFFLEFRGLKDLE